MAKVADINSAQKKLGHQSKNTKNNRELVAYFLIVCEGEKTEPNYFKAFPKQAGRIVYDIKFDGGGISTLRVVEKAIELRNSSSQKYDRVWAVFDRDSFKSNSFNSAILKAKANDICCAWSNQAFELWYLLHFHNRVTAMDRTDYKKAIEEAINEKKPKKKFKYEKNSPSMYSVLNQYGNQSLAIRWAQNLNNIITGENFANYNPTTQVFKLVKELIGQSQELKDEIIKKYSEGK